LGRRQTNRFQTSSKVAVQPPQQFEQRGAGLLLALVSGTVHFPGCILGGLRTRVQGPQAGKWLHVLITLTPVTSIR
jgi:hypothetical protein